MEASDIIMNCGGVTYVILPIFFVAVMNQILSQVRSLSIITHMLLIHVQIPGIAMLFYMKIFQIVKFDIFEAVFKFDEVLDTIFNFDQLPINQDASDLGYESRYIIINLGAIVFYWAILLALQIFFYLVLLLSSRLGKSCKRV